MPKDIRCRNWIYNLQLPKIKDFLDLLEHQVRDTFALGCVEVTLQCKSQLKTCLTWDFHCRVSDLGIRNLVNNCKFMIDLNLSGCKVLWWSKLSVFSSKIIILHRVHYRRLQNVTDESLELIAENYQGLQLLNLTRYCGHIGRFLRVLNDDSLHALPCFSHCLCSSDRIHK